MVDPQDAVALDLAAAEFKEGEKSGFWRFVCRRGDLVYMEVFAWNGDEYLLELTCDHYRSKAILGRFVDHETFQCIATAWPQGDGTFGGWFKWQPEHLFICWPGDRGGIYR